jgi:7-carboxy-7-deazaguanine synthase
MQNAFPTNWERLDRCLAAARDTVNGSGPQIYLKVVIFDEEDYRYARYVNAHYPDIPLYLQVGNHTPPQRAEKIDHAGILQRMEWLVQRTIDDRWYTVTVLPQLHTLLWGNRRGV